MRRLATTVVAGAALLALAGCTAADTPVASDAPAPKFTAGSGGSASAGVPIAGPTTSGSVSAGDVATSPALVAPAGGIPASGVYVYAVGTGGSTTLHTVHRTAAGDFKSSERRIKLPSLVRVEDPATVSQLGLFSGDRAQTLGCYTYVDGRLYSSFPPKPMQPQGEVSCRG